MLFLYLKTANVDEIKSPNKSVYFDTLPDGRLNKSRSDKQKKFRDSLVSKLGNDCGHEFTVKWNDKYGDIFNIVTPKLSDEQNNADASFFGINKFDDEFKHYLHSFNTVVVSNIKALVGKKLQEDANFTAK